MHNAVLIAITLAILGAMLVCLFTHCPVPPP
jgi:hypothetical protein